MVFFCVVIILFIVVWQCLQKSYCLLLLYLRIHQSALLWWLGPSNYCNYWLNKSWATVGLSCKMWFILALYVLNGTLPFPCRRFDENTMCMTTWVSINLYYYYYNLVPFQLLCNDMIFICEFYVNITTFNRFKYFDFPCHCFQQRVEIVFKSGSYKAWKRLCWN